MQIRMYSEEDSKRWDEFISSSINATFLHTRKFLSYHGNRFIDQSLIIYDNKEWLGVFPAANHPEQPSVIVSHPGITYGGMIHCGRLLGTSMIEALEKITVHYRNRRYEKLHYKVVPNIYQRPPAQDDLYAIFRLGGNRYRCDLSSSIDLSAQLPQSNRRHRSLKKAKAQDIQIKSGNCCAPVLWPIIEDNLRRKHGQSPAHQLSEILFLAKQFPENIEFVIARLQDNFVAGVVLFRCGPVVHAQYIAASELGNKICALDAVLDYAIQQARKSGARFFDFGISNEHNGHILNDGLYRFKSEFGGSGVVHEFYELDLTRLRHAS
jgi:hypothetical protein